MYDFWSGQGPRVIVTVTRLPSSSAGLLRKDSCVSSSYYGIALLSYGFGANIIQLDLDLHIIQIYHQAVRLQLE